MKSSTIFWGLALVVVGLALLAGNLLNINIWAYLWPVALILTGLWILFGSRLRNNKEIETLTVPLEGAAAARVRIDHGAGRLVISGGAAPDNLAEGTFGGGVNFKRVKIGDAAEVEFLFPEINFPDWAPGDSRVWDVHLNDRVPITLAINTGAGETRADLSGLNVTGVTLKTGASSVDLTLPSVAGSTQVKVEGGATSVNIHVPEGVAARIHTDSGLSSINVDTLRFARQDGGGYVSPDFNTAAKKVELSIEVGVGSVTVR